MFKYALSVLALLALALGAPLFAAQAQNFDSIPAGNDNAPTEAQPAAQAQPAAPAPAPATTGGCQDDPRLEGELLAIMASDKPVSPPITVTPETFINLDPEVLARLSGQMIICPNNPVLKSGKPMRKVVAPFEVIWDNLRKAAIAGDEARVKQVLTSYTAAPKTTEEIANLRGIVDLNDKTKQALYKAAGIAIPSVSGGRVIDFYTVLGGKPSDKKTVYVLGADSVPEEFQGDENKNLRESSIFILLGRLASHNAMNELGNSFRRLGIDVK